MKARRASTDRPRCASQTHLNLRRKAYKRCRSRGETVDSVDLRSTRARDLEVSKLLTLSQAYLGWCLSSPSCITTETVGVRLQPSIVPSRKSQPRLVERYSTLPAFSQPTRQCWPGCSHFRAPQAPTSCSRWARSDLRLTEVTPDRFVLGVVNHR